MPQLPQDARSEEARYRASQNVPQLPWSQSLVPSNENRAWRSVKPALRVTGGCFEPTYFQARASLIFCGTTPPLASTGPAALSIDRDQYYSSQMIPPWQWCHSDCASQQVRCAFRRPTRCAGLPDTLHGTTPAYQAKDASLCSLSAAISTALTNQGGSQHEDRATTIGSPPGSPKSSLCGY